MKMKNKDYKKLYENALERAKSKLHYPNHPCFVDVTEIFPELKESEDEKIRKEIIQFLQLPHLQFVGKRNHEEWVAWLKKQGEQKSEDNVKSKFRIGDWIATNGKYIWKIIDIEQLDYILQSQNGVVVNDTISYVDEDFHLWTIQDAKDGDVLVDNYGNILIYEKTVSNTIYHSHCYGNEEEFFEQGGGHRIECTHPATKEQRDFLFTTMKEAGYEWDEENKVLKKIEQKLDKWEPQTGDTFRKKGTTSPTYHLCDKREDGITFGFVENCEVGICGGEITIFALKQSYELVERPQLIEYVVEEEINKGLQTKIEQKAAWSVEDEQNLNASLGYIGDEYLRRWLKDIIHVKYDKLAWSEEDEKNFLDLESLIHSYRTGDNEYSLSQWLKSLKERVQPKTELSENAIVKDYIRDDKLWEKN